MSQILFYFLYFLCFLGLVVGIATAYPFVVIISIFCAILIIVEEDNQSLFNQIDPKEEHTKETKKAYDEAMKLPTTKERIDYFTKGMYNRIHKRMLNEVSRRK